MKRPQCGAQTQAVVDIAEGFRVQFPSSLVSPVVAETEVFHSRECLQIDHSVYGGSKRDAQEHRNIWYPAQHVVV